MARQDEIIKERLRKLEELRKNNINPYPYYYKQKINASELHEKYKKLKPAQKTKNKVSVAGRVINIRDMGNLIFLDLQDDLRIQLQLQKSETKNSEINFLKKYIDSGDFIGAEGTIIKTKRGELTVLVKKIELLAKSILPLPEKWHGLQDKEERYRKRYLDLIANPEVKDVFIKREKIINEVRSFLKEKNFVEVETPALQSIYGGASARPFKTHLNALDIDLFLSISPELYLKRLIVGGFEKVFTISKNFRNEGIDAFHNPEFTMLEFYYAYENYETLMKMTEELFDRLKKSLKLKDEIEYQGKKINLKTPFKKIKFRDLLLKEVGIDINKTNTYEKLKYEIERKNIKNADIKDCKYYGALLDDLYKKVIRPGIIQPVFLTHYPVEMIALAKRNENDKTKINTFQLIINSSEIVKAYDELNDPTDQETRLLEQAKLLHEGEEAAMPMDSDFINALKHGMPPTAGYGLGIDRLTMLLTNSASIRDVILFPFMRPEKGKQ